MNTYKIVIIIHLYNGYPMTLINGKVKKNKNHY